MPLNFEVTTIESRLAGWGMSVIFDDLHALVNPRDATKKTPVLAGVSFFQIGRLNRHDCFNQFRNDPTAR